jgi:hypothetical protein
MCRGEVWIGTTAAFVLCGAGLIEPARAGEPGPPPPAAAAGEAPTEEGKKAQKSGENGVAKDAPTAASAPPQRARPALPPPPPAVPLRWQRHLDLGPDLAIVVRPGTKDAAGFDTKAHLRPAPGWGIHLGWQVLRYLHFSGYFIGAAHELDLPRGALGVMGTMTHDKAVHTYVFGARVMPTYPFTERFRVWLSAGAGWGRISYPRIEVREGSHPPFSIYERDAFLVEFPMGIGATYELIPRWLNLELGFTGAPLLSQQGDALEKTQTIDYGGHKRTIGPLPKLDASFVQTFGLSLIL